MTATILWAVVAAWLLFVGIALLELVRGWRGSGEPVEPPSFTEYRRPRIAKRGYVRSPRRP